MSNLVDSNNVAKNDDEEEHDINSFDGKGGRKIPKISNKYKKFIHPKYLNYRFKSEELDQLCNYKVN